MADLIISKIVAVSGEVDLAEYDDFYYPEIGLYLFFSEASYDPVIKKYSGRKLLHDQLISKYHLEDIPKDQLVYITIDITSHDCFHTYMRINRRGLQLSDDQIAYIMMLFKADYLVS